MQHIINRTSNLLIPLNKNVFSKTFSRYFSSSNGGTMVVVEHDNNKMSENNLMAFAAATKLPKPITGFVAGHDCKNVVQSVKGIFGVSNVAYIDSIQCQHGLPEFISQAILSYQKQKNFSHIIAASSSYSKNILPRVAAILNVAAISDVLKIENDDTFLRPIYAGNAISKIQSSDPIKVITIRSTAFPKAILVQNNATEEKLNIILNPVGTKWIEDNNTKSVRPELTTARIVVSGGRGLKSGENFKLLEELADRFEAAVGASRAAVDAGFVPNDMQVGQTGKIVAPEVYIAVGISGAIQHLDGMKDSKIIIAINKDPDAPIFQVSDYGLVGDLFTIVPALNKLLQK